MPRTDQVVVRHLSAKRPDRLGRVVVQESGGSNVLSTTESVSRSLRELGTDVVARHDFREVLNLLRYDLVRRDGEGLLRLGDRLWRCVRTGRLRVGRQVVPCREVEDVAMPGHLPRPVGEQARNDKLELDRPIEFVGPYVVDKFVGCGGGY